MKTLVVFLVKIFQATLLAGSVCAANAATAQAPKSPLQTQSVSPSAAPKSAPGAAPAKAAASESLGLATFSGPAGWTRKSQPNFVTFESTNPSKGTWSVIAVYRNRAATGDAAAEFSAEWVDLVGSRFQAGVPAEVETRQDPVGYTIKLGGANVQSDAGVASAILVAATGNGNVVSVLFLTNTMDTLAVFDRFVQGVSLKRPEATTAAAASTGKAAASGTAAPSAARPNELVGTWINSGVSGPAMYDRINGSFEGFASGSGGFLEIKPNGQVQLTLMHNNKGGCGSSIYTNRSGTWSASATVLTINFTSGEGQIETCGKKSNTKAVLLGVEAIPYRLYSFQGRPAISLRPDTNAAQSFYKK